MLITRNFNFSRTLAIKNINRRKQITQIQIAKAFKIVRENLINKIS